MSNTHGAHNDYNYNPFGQPNQDSNQYNPTQHGQPHQPLYQNFSHQQQFNQPQQFGNFPAQQYHAQAPGYYDHNGLPAAPKSKVVAAILAFFLGGLGVHNFYLGYTNRGVAQIVTNIVAFVTSIILIGIFIYIALGIWVLVEFISILVSSGVYRTDARGIPLE